MWNHPRDLQHCWPISRPKFRAQLRSVLAALRLAALLQVVQFLRPYRELLGCTGLFTIHLCLPAILRMSVRDDQFVQRKVGLFPLKHHVATFPKRFDLMSSECNIFGMVVEPCR